MELSPRRRKVGRVCLWVAALCCALMAALSAAEPALFAYAKWDAGRWVRVVSPAVGAASFACLAWLARGKPPQGG